MRKAPLLVGSWMGDLCDLLKILGRAEIFEKAQANEWIEKVRDPKYEATVKRVFVIRVEGFDWNCQQHIIPRYTGEEIRKALAPLERRMHDLEQENDKLREELSRVTTVASLTTSALSRTFLSFSFALGSIRAHFYAGATDAPWPDGQCPCSIDLFLFLRVHPIRSARVSSSTRCCPPTISSATGDHDELFELPPMGGGG